MQRRRESSNERYKRIIRQRRIFVLCVFVLVILLCICLFTPLFGISDITVSGNTVVSSEEVITASGIEKGENVFRINKSKAKKALSAIAYVEGVEIKRKFPARVEIAIDEATPDMIIDTPTQFVVTTINGRVLQVTDDVTNLTSPIVYGIAISEAEPAQNIQPADQEQYAMHMEYIRCFYGAAYWPDIDEFYLSDDFNLTVIMKSGTKVTFGSVESLESLQRKIMMMSKIFEQVEQTEHSYLDLTTDKGYFGTYTAAELEEMERKAQAAEKQNANTASEDGEKSPADEQKPSSEKSDEPEGEKATSEQRRKSVAGAAEESNNN